ncbi:MAG TPA: hypothetical protein VLE74_01620 [Candidatus Saccharimonadales bacterium]|nr:hypothetical protein [Candidatus Saccharimonadales bacterium]
MVTPSDKNQPPTPPYHDQKLRHEAGEGWHPDGLNQQILGAAVIRDAILAKREDFPNDPGYNKELDIWDKRVEELKTQYHSQDELPFGE